MKRTIVVLAVVALTAGAFALFAPSESQAMPSHSRVRSYYAYNNADHLVLVGEWEMTCSGHIISWGQVTSIVQVRETPCGGGGSWGMCRVWINGFPVTVPCD